jgi:hypothetical protein
MGKTKTSKSVLSSSLVHLCHLYALLLFHCLMSYAKTSVNAVTVLFYSSSLYMVCVATILSVVVVNLARNHHATPLPWLLKDLLTGWLGQVLCLGHIIDQVQHYATTTALTAHHSNTVPCRLSVRKRVIATLTSCYCTFDNTGCSYA